MVDYLCEWSGMRIKLKKSLITAYDFCKARNFPTENINHQGKPLTSLPADGTFPYLGIRARIPYLGIRARTLTSFEIKTNVIGLT